MQSIRGENREKLISNRFLHLRASYFHTCALDVFGMLHRRQIHFALPEGLKQRSAYNCILSFKKDEDE